MKSLILLACMVVALTQGAPDVTCNFETDDCSWQNMDGNLWTWANSYASGDPDKPTRDVTISNHDGHYVYAVLSATDPSPKFISPSVASGNAIYCFRLSLYASDASEAAVRVSVVETGKHINAVEIASAFEDKMWSQDSVEFSVNNDFKIQLEGVLINSAVSALIAVDEIRLTRGYCN